MAKNVRDPLEFANPELKEAASYIEVFTYLRTRMLSPDVILNIDPFLANYLPA